MKILKLTSKLNELAYAHDVKFNGILAEHKDEYEVVFMVHADEYKSLLRVPSSGLEDQLLISVRSSDVDSSLESLSGSESGLTLESFIAATLEYMVNEENDSIEEYWYNWFNPIMSNKKSTVHSYNMQCFTGDDIVVLDVDIVTEDMVTSSIWVSLPGGSIKRKIKDTRLIHYTTGGDTVSININFDKLSEDVTEWLLVNKNAL